MIVAPQRRNSSATVDLPAPILPVRATESISLQQRRLVFVPARHRMAVPAASLIALSSANHDGGRVISRWLAINQALVPASRVPADHADGLEFVDHLGYRHELTHRAERLAGEVGVGPRQYRPNAPGSQTGGHVQDLPIQELRFVNGDNLGIGTNQAEDLGRGIDWTGLELPAVVTGDAVQPGITSIEVGFEDLHLAPGNGGATDSTNQLLALATEHDAADDLDPSGVHAVVHLCSADVMGMQNVEARAGNSSHLADD